MNEPEDYCIPTYAELEAADPLAFALWNGADAPVPVERVQLERGVGMNADYECYLAFFALPHGLVVEQANYRLLGPQAQQWVLLMTPAQPEPDGRPVLQAVIHRQRKRLIPAGA